MMSSAPAPIDSGLGRWSVRIFATLGCVLIVAASIGWWLDSRVLSSDGFADVVAKSSQQAPVREYIADQATLRLARTSNFVSAARPVVTDALSTAIATPPVEDAIRDFARRAHDQILSARDVRRVDIDAQQASTTIRSALQTINPSLSKKLPANVLDASATISQNPAVDQLFTISRWVRLWIPVGIVGIVLLGYTLKNARDRVHAVRAIGIALAISGALVAGLGSATPVLAGIAAPGDPGKGRAVAAFIAVLTGRLAGSGLALILIGLTIALAPGPDGGDLADRWRRVRAWVARQRLSARWRFAGGLAIVVIAAKLLTNPVSVAKDVVALAAVIGFYVGVVVCLRAAGILVPDATIERLPKRRVVAVFAAMLAASVASGGLVAGVVSANTGTGKANPLAQGCNGFIELCFSTLDDVIWPASHNAMSSAAYNFLGAEHVITVPEQLNSGVRFLMLDAYYGHDDRGLVRTNLAGGVDRAQLVRDRGKAAADALERVGALTGTADTSTKGQDVYLCHSFCELGAVKATDVFADVDKFLARNRTDVVVLDMEDYVQPRDMKKALVEAGLFDRVLTLDRSQLSKQRLADLVTPTGNATEAPRRVIMISEKHGGTERWFPKTYDFFGETPFTFASERDFNCSPKRGGLGNPLLLINHWLRESGAPDPVQAASVNSAKALTTRFQQCIAARHQLPNTIAVDFTTSGDMIPTVNRWNAAVARVTGATSVVDVVLRAYAQRPDITPSKLAELKGLHRLPRISMKDARRLLGVIADPLAAKSVLNDPRFAQDIEAQIIADGERLAAGKPLEKHPARPTVRLGG